MAISTITINSKLVEKFKVEIECSKPFIIDQPKAGGGDGEGPNPLEIYLTSIGGCICSIGKIIANQRKLNIRSIEAKVEGDIDKNFLLGMTKEGRAGFVKIRTFVKIDADMTKEEKTALMEEIVERCPIADNSINSTIIEGKLVD